MKTGGSSSPGLRESSVCGGRLAGWPGRRWSRPGMASWPAGHGHPGPLFHFFGENGERSWWHTFDWGLLSWSQLGFASLAVAEDAATGPLAAVRRRTEKNQEARVWLRVLPGVLGFHPPKRNNGNGGMGQYLRFIFFGDEPPFRCFLSLRGSPPYHRFQYQVMLDLGYPYSCEAGNSLASKRDLASWKRSWCEPVGNRFEDLLCTILYTYIHTYHTIPYHTIHTYIDTYIHTHTYIYTL